MKKKLIYAISLLFFAAAILFIIFRSKISSEKKDSAWHEVLPRKTNNTMAADWSLAKSKADDLIQAIQKNPNDHASLLQLTALYLNEARISGNTNYYDVAALNSVNKILQRDSSNFEALIYKAMIFLSQHHFAEGLAMAEQARQKNPYNAFVHGLLVDAHVELGDYAKAVVSAEQMISIRPDLRSYSRVSYLREIHGDLPGAIDAMKLAVEAGMPGDENTEWCRVQEGKLYEQAGDMHMAEMLYAMALNNLPHYMPAIAGLARMAEASKNYTKAMALYLHADSMTYDYSCKEAMVEVYKLSGENEKAESLAKTIIADMEKTFAASGKNDSAGHYADREMAFVYLAVNDYDKALAHALLEYNRRPGNIDVNETVAWAYYCKGDYEKAGSYIATALKTNSKNPTLLCHAGIIYASLGDKTIAKKMLEQALQTKPYISTLLKTQTEEVMQSM